jgi:hypothetical protein
MNNKHVQWAELWSNVTLFLGEKPQMRSFIRRRGKRVTTKRIYHLNYLSLLLFINYTNYFFVFKFAESLVLCQLLRKLCIQLFIPVNDLKCLIKVMWYKAPTHLIRVTWPESGDESQGREQRAGHLILTANYWKSTLSRRDDRYAIKPLYLHSGVLRAIISERTHASMQDKKVKVLRFWHITSSTMTSMVDCAVDSHFWFYLLRYLIFRN